MVLGSSRRERAPRRSLVCVSVCALLGACGWLPGAAGPFDPLATCAWLAVVALGAGWLCGALAVRLAHALLVPAAWALCLVLALTRSPRELPTPLDASAVVAGLFLAGHGLGRLLGRPYAGSGAALLLALALCGPSLAGGFPERSGASEPSPLAATHPALARAALALSPWVLVLESAGWDVTHAHPRLYRASGVDWLPRRPRGRLAAPAALVVGSLLAAGAAAAGRARDRKGATDDVSP